jgi:hypothetical protein
VGKRLFRGGAWTPCGGELVHTRRGPAHRRQHRQAAGATEAEIMLVRGAGRQARPPMRRCGDANARHRGFLRGREAAFTANARCAMMLGKLFRTGGGNHASLYSPNPCRGGVDLFQRARCCIGADCNNSKRHSSFSRTFEPSHFNCHELHDVLQLAVGELPNTLRPARTAGPPSQSQQ